MLTPEVLRLGGGDTTGVGISVTLGGRRITPAVRWVSAAPAVVAVDSQTATQPRARVQAAGVGSTAINFTVSVQGQMVNGSVPVTVTAR